MAAAIIRIFKAFGSPANKPWVNTYEVGIPGTDPLAVAPIDPVAALGYVTTIVGAERVLHNKDIVFVRGTVSTYRPDSVPYNPDSVVTVPLNDRGQAGQLNDLTLEDLRIVLSVNRGAATGRPGRLFYRGCVTEADVETLGGHMRLNSASPVNDVFGTYAHALVKLLTPADGAGGQLVIISGVADSRLITRTVTRAGRQMTENVAQRFHIAPFTQRPVVNMTLGGVTTVSADHRYFDKGAA